MFTGLITGPLLARSLGADGRGLLAAVAVPLGLLPYLAQLGTGSFAVNQVAKGTAASRVFGSIAVPLVVVGLAITFSSPRLAHTLTQGKEPAEHYLTIGLALIPLGLLLNLVLDITWGLSAWRVLVVARALTPISLLISTTVLFLAGALTVSSASVLAIATGLAPALAIAP